MGELMSTSTLPMTNAKDLCTKKKSSVEGGLAAVQVPTSSSPCSTTPIKDFVIPVAAKVAGLMFQSAPTIHPRSYDKACLPTFATIFMLRSVGPSPEWR